MEYIYRVTRPGGSVRVGTKHRITSILNCAYRGIAGWKVERAPIGEWEDATKDFAHLGYHFDDEEA